MNRSTTIILVVVGLVLLLIACCVCLALFGGALYLQISNTTYFISYGNQRADPPGHPANKPGSGNSEGPGNSRGSGHHTA